MSKIGRKLAVIILAAGLGACAGTSYGASTDGSFPPKPHGAPYPDWEHMCVVFTESNATDALNEASQKGWELVTLGNQGTDNLMCFKRPQGMGE